MTARSSRIALTLSFALALAGPVAAKDPAASAPDGQALYAQNCVRCHQSEVFTRPDHKIGSLPALKAQVRRCETMLELTWFDEDIDAVATYVNNQYYHFKP